jgi:hypothetical protein
MIVVRKHKGRSGISVYEWRVYRVTSGPKVHNTQVAKYRTVEEANRAADFYRARDIEVARKWQQIGGSR